MQGIESKDIDKKIYRIFDIERFEQMLLDNANIFVAPRLWDDPYEDILYSIFKDNDEIFFDYKVNRHALFGQCWTTNEDSDAMWRIYSQRNRGVKVEVKLRDYHDYLEVNSNGSGSRVLVSKVEYLSSRKIEENLLDAKVDADFLYGLKGGWDDFPNIRMKSLSYKRTEFEHEKEIRVLLYTSNAQKNQILKIEMDINKIFKAITLDPRLKKDEFEYLKKRLQTLGYKGKIKQSELYRLSEDFKNTIVAYQREFTPTKVPT
ncbi:DUF2971 domain-containing protein [Petrocella sp. FN5]|uniref:DUF2971 domain-containing protein n=1 Tax=Petrocella sp. FN5 TaxID=3032002 RepID=UPI0023DBA469|nr:DUF2971 domain-containing protein [Petrocella sp. FN5]MDF1617322.1 hypothetical protein [Petrocella sp. FN5]